MTRLHINIGSNKGDRAALIERAVALIAYSLDPGGHAEIRLAPLVESAPWGYESPNPYLNLGMTVDLPADDVDPHAVLRKLRAVEREISATPHRDPSGAYVDREIDIDLIAVGQMTVNDEILTLPHPRMQQRRFVLEPMAALDPVWTHPLSGLTAAQMLKSLL